MKLFQFIFCVFSICFLIKRVESVHLAAYISQNGLHGEFHFTQFSKDEVQIKAKLETTLQYTDQIWSWEIHQYPVDYSNGNSIERCEASKLGSKIIGFDESLGYLILPGNETSIWTEKLNLTGENGLWGKSILLHNYDLGFRICATITTHDSSLEHIAEARFHTPIAGSIFFRWLVSKETNHYDTLIYSNLLHIQDETPKKVEQIAYTQHSWKIYVTDIFEADNDKAEENCDILQLVFDPQNKGNGESIGDIDRRIGPLHIAVDGQKYESRQLFKDSDLILLPSDLSGPQRRLYLVIFDPYHPEQFLSCSKIRHIKPRTAKAIINGDGIKGEITLTQRSRFEPTWLNFTMASANKDPVANIEYARNVASFRITELPEDPVRSDLDNNCVTGGNIYNPLGLNLKTIPPPGFGTQDQYPIGDLTGKLQSRNKLEKHNYYIPGASSELSGIYWDVFLPLEGQSSVYHRGLTVQKFNQSDPTDIKEQIWTCGLLALYEPNGWTQKEIFTAQVLFRYPIVGRILMRQPKEEPWLDTVLIVEYLIHADGASQNNSMGHRWAIHKNPPGKDFYNWTQRCLSAEEVFNPYKVTFDDKPPEESCTSQYIDQCRMGDLWNRLGPLTIAGRKSEGKRLSRKMFTVQNFPLSGYNRILGRSMVIYDDFGPKARGERLACSIIGGHYRRKAVAKNWYPNGDPLTVKGKLELIQSSEYDLTNVEVDLSGLVANSGYHVHVTPVESDLVFPCEDRTLYGHWNPRDVNPKLSPPPGNGSTDQYELGDLSGKFGTLEGYKTYETVYNDTSLPLFGYESIIGRSVVIHKKEKNVRWACSTLERGYSPSEARELRAIASFHHPAGYAYGYIRMTQLIHSDGSQSDTIIEVKLRHPGVNDRNITRNHNWQIWVNSVGVDAAVQQVETRCVAGGYIWNPYYTQLADPLNGDLYRQECGPDNPLRCYVGDVSARLGPIDLGDRRVVFTDPNFPLEGVVSAIGRSIVLFGPNFSGNRFACANIEPDHDIIKHVNLQRPPRFVVAQFLEEVRSVMGLPEWMLAVDSRNIKTLHGGGCVQMIVHFQGPKAHEIEMDLTKLLATGRLENPTVYVPGYINPKRKKKLAYKQCGVRDPNEKKPKRVFFSLSSGGEYLRSSLICFLIPIFILRLA